MNPRIWVAASFKVKNRWPVFQILQFESSPSTHTSKKSASSRSRILMVRSVTLRTRRAATGVAATSRSGSESSSSNGRSKRSDIGEIDELFLAVADSLNLVGATGFLVGLDDDGVHPRIAFSGFKADRHAGQKASERRLDLDTNDRVVRSGHADVG